MIVILAYDIASDTRRARLAAALEGWGYRLQESVFQLRLEPAELDEVRRQVTETINQADDVIHLYPLCDSCLARSEVHGTSLRARRRRAVPRGMVSRQHAENARLTGVSHPACDDDRVLRDDQCRRPR